MNNDDLLDESRLLCGPRGLAVYVPPKPPVHPDDHKLDFPPGLPPEVHYQGIRANYWLVLREKQMPFMNGTKVFCDEEMAWLSSIENDIYNLLLKYGYKVIWQ